MSKLDELKEKFQSAIEDFKSKIPAKFGGTKGLEVDDDEEFDESDSTGEVDISKLANNTGDDELEEDEEGQLDEDKAKNKKKLLIRGAVLIIIAYLAVDEFVLKDESSVVPEVTPVKRKRPKRKRIRKKRPKKVSAKAEATKSNTVEPKTTASPALKNDQNKKADIIKKETVSKGSKINIPPETASIPVPIPADKKEEVDKKIAVNPEVKEIKAVKEIEVVKEIEAAKEVKPVAEVGEVKQGDSENNVVILDSAISDLVEKTKENSSLEESKMEKLLGKGKLGYVAPPSYQRFGRGLVYNCKEKHWACVDKFSYFKCRENYMYSKQNKKDPECAIRNVYASSDDCRTVQVHYVNTVKKTPFCDGDFDEKKKLDVDSSTEVFIE